MQVSKLSDSDFEEYSKLFFYSFNIDPKIDDRKSLEKMYQHATNYGLKDRDKLKASIMCIPFVTNFFGQKFKITSLANVMSAPEFDQSQGISSLTEQALIDMHQDSIVLSYLDPFSYSYYRRFGFEQAFELAKIEFPFEKFVRVNRAESGYIKRMKFAEAAELIYGIFNRNNNFGGINEDPWWWEILKLRYADYSVALSYDEKNTLTGYVIYSFENESFIVEDLLYETPDSFKSIMNFIGQHRSNFQTLVINSSDVRVKPSLFTIDPVGITKTIEPFMMVRIVDLQKFLLAYPYRVNNIEAISFKVRDDLSWNNRIWNLNIVGGQSELRESDDSKYDFDLDIRTLTMAMFGYQSLEDSYRTGKVEGSLEKIQKLDNCFIKTPAQLNGKF